jgi:hypothetical protein
VSTTRKLPRHGTRARYRLEIKPGPNGEKGIPCEPCKTANRKAAAAARASRAANKRRADMHIVDAPSADTIPDTDPDTPAAADDAKPEAGEMERAIEEGLAELDPTMRIPLQSAREVMVRQLAKDFDSLPAGAARQSVSKQLFEVMNSLRPEGSGDGNSAFDLYLEDLGSGPPSVPGRRA